MMIITSFILSQRENSIRTSSPYEYISIFLFEFFRYFVISGTAEKMLEYFLETYVCVNYEEGDTSLDDFLSTYVIFMPINHICSRLISIYKAKPQQRLGENIDLVLQQKVKVIRFIVEWYDVSRETFFEDSRINVFLDVCFILESFL